MSRDDIEEAKDLSKTRAPKTEALSTELLQPIKQMDPSSGTATRLRMMIDPQITSTAEIVSEIKFEYFYPVGNGEEVIPPSNIFIEADGLNPDFTDSDMTLDSASASDFDRF